jgi:hypothetical protein
LRFAGTGAQGRETKKKESQGREKTWEEKQKTGPAPTERKPKNRES